MYAAGADVIAEISELLHARDTEFSRVSQEIALRLFETGYHDQAFQIAIRIAEDESRKYPDYTAAWICLSVADPGRLPAVLEVVDRLPKRTGEEGARIMRRLVEIGETVRAREWAWAISSQSHHTDHQIVSEALKVLLLDTDPLTLAEEIGQLNEQENLAGGKIAAVELAVKLGDRERAAAMVRRFFIESGHGFGDDPGKMVRLLIQCEGLKASEEALTFIRAMPKPWRSERVVIGAANQLSLVGALPAATSLWQELLTDLSASITASFQACSAMVQSGQRDLALTTLRTALTQDGISPANRARLSALTSWVLARDPEAPSPPYLARQGEP